MIVKTPGVCGGSARLNDTRIPVWLCIQYGTPEKVLEFYPHLTEKQIKEAFVYYAFHKAEIDKDIQDNTED